MTDLHLPRLDLARAVTDALARGRYVLMTDGDGRPKEITLDLKERPDDLFGGEWQEYAVSPGEAPSDDHGPAIPAQGELHRSAEVVGEENGWAVRKPGPIVYEFALQDFNAALAIPFQLDTITADAVRQFGFADAQRALETADYVHVYDRVTRERRTLKRPEPDRILTGLRDVAADLRRGPGVAERAMLDPTVDKSFPRGAPVEPPFGCAALPPVGPLTSTEGLRPGDVVRCIAPRVQWPYGPLSVSAVTDAKLWPVMAKSIAGSIDARFNPDELAFVGRPDADGWMTWAGGENPVPGAEVEVNWGLGAYRCSADDVRWIWDVDGGPGDIKRFRIVDTPPAV